MKRASRVRSLRAGRVVSLRLALRGVSALRGLWGRAAGAWWNLRPAQQLVLGFASYVIIGTALLCLPWAQAVPGAPIDHLFNATSAVSTTGLTTISVSDSYTFFGELVLLVLFQLGGIGYMTVSSVLVLARGKPLSGAREGVLRAGFAVPHYFVLSRFVVHVVVYTAVVEVIGAALLWWRFAALGVEGPAWSAVFHAVSAFATAGFSLNNTSLEAFRTDWVVNLVIGSLCYLGAVGFIIVQDVWFSLRFREHMITFTSKVILWMTGAIFVLGTAAVWAIEPSVRGLPPGERFLACAFQVMTASSTAGFNTIPIAPLSMAVLVVIMVAMVIGASPSGTGGGIKTTTVSALLANVVSVLRGSRTVAMLGHDVPITRVLAATAAATFYLVCLAAGVGVLALTEQHAFLPVVFEAVSALGTVGLSMGITADLSWLGKVVVIVLMFAGRCGPLTIGLALLRPEARPASLRADDLAV
jgi:trk system potassium uptake protein TrkH